MLRNLFIQDWQYKLLALFIGTALWLVLNLGESVTMSVERNIELVNQEPGYEYRLERKRVKIRLRVMERFVSQDMIEGIRAQVDVRGLEEGDYMLRVSIESFPRFLVSLERVEPSEVRVKVVRAPQRGQ